MARAIVFLAAVVIAVCIASSVYATNPRKTLVILDDLAQRSTYSKYFDELKKFSIVEFRRANDESINFSLFHEWQYDGLVMFAPRAEELGGNLSVDSIIQFIDEGHDVVVAASSDASWITREIASAVGVEIDDEGARVFDHFNYDQSDDGSHTLIAATNYENVPAILGSDAINPILYKGPGMSLNPDNTLAFRLLSGSSTSYSLNPSDSSNQNLVAGTGNVLVAGLQARNNARVSVFGSIELFSNKYWSSSVRSSSGKTADKSGNARFALELTKWTFHHRGVLRARDIRHHRAGELEQPETYTINDTIEYSLVIEEFSNNEWVPFKADDVQLEFVMLDPYVRTTLTHDDNGNYIARYTAPDVYGIFTFRLDYHRLGYSTLSDVRRIVVRPYRHNEYERFIIAAYPYYASAFSMIGALFILSVIFLYHRD